MVAVFGSGQSNHNGHEPGGRPWGSYRDDLLAWNNPVDQSSAGNGWVRPRRNRPPFPGLSANNYHLRFCNLLGGFLNAPTRDVVNAKGGQSIDGWVSGNLPMMIHAANVWNAIQEAGNISQSAPIFLWNQGQADFEQMADYPGKFAAMVSRHKNNKIITANARILVGGMAETSDAANAMNAVLAQLSGVTFIPARDSTGAPLPTADGVHFTGAALHELGRQYFLGWRDRQPNP